MARCRTAAPPLFQTEQNRAAACFLHETAPVLPGGVATLLVPAE
jgi:hypothetical protein